jgi:hypothetical protein
MTKTTKVIAVPVTSKVKPKFVVDTNSVAWRKEVAKVRAMW